MLLIERPCKPKLLIGQLPAGLPLWLLTPQEIGRAEVEIRRLAAEAKRLDRTSEAMAQEFGDGSDEYEAEVTEYYG